MDNNYKELYKPTSEEVFFNCSKRQIPDFKDSYADIIIEKYFVETISRLFSDFEQTGFTWRTERKYNELIKEKVLKAVQCRLNNLI